MLTVRMPETIHRATGLIQDGTFEGRWHFSFDRYHDPEHVHFGALRVFNDDTLSPGAVWPLHPHVDNEVVTYVAGGVFRHADEHGEGGLLEKGWVQHTTVGTGMWHSEINVSPTEPMRFIQMWFIPTVRGLPPAMQQRAVDRADRLGRFLPLVSDDHSAHPEALPLVSKAAVYSCALTAGDDATVGLRPGYGGYLYVLEGGPVRVTGARDTIMAPTLAAVEALGEGALLVQAEAEAELLLVETGEETGQRSSADAIAK